MSRLPKLGADALRNKTPREQDLEKVKSQRSDIYIICDNVLDTYNIGAIFRLADAVGVKRIYLCEGSETPPNTRIQKASVGTWQWVDWEYSDTTMSAIKKLRREVENVKIVAVELSSDSVPYTEYDYGLPVALIVGHESDGVKQEVIDECNATVELPMRGVNISLNVMVSLGIVLYEVLEKNGLN